MGIKTRQLVLEQIEAFLNAHPEKRWKPRKRRAVTLPIQEYGRGGKTVMSAPRVRPVDQGEVKYYIPGKRLGIKEVDSIVEKGQYSEPFIEDTDATPAAVLSYLKGRLL